MKKDKVIKAVEYFSLSIFFVLVLLVILQVFFRYVLQISVPWTEELARVMYMWLVFIGIIIVEAENINIRTTYFLDKMSLKVRYVMEIIINVSAIVFLLVLFYGSILITKESWVYMLGSIPWISSAITYIPAIIGAPLTIWFLIKQIIDMNKNIKPSGREVGM